MIPNYSLARGLASEAAVETALNALKGKDLVENGKQPTLRRRILDFFRAKANDETDRRHADFIVKVESDISPGVIEVPIQTKSSERAAQGFERKCRICHWGPIPVVVVEDDDSPADLLSKVKSALIKGYNFMRNELSKMIYRCRSKFSKRQRRNRRHHRDHHSQWCPRFHAARMCH